MNYLFSRKFIADPPSSGFNNTLLHRVGIVAAYLQEIGIEAIERADYSFSLVRDLDNAVHSGEIGTRLASGQRLLVMDLDYMGLANSLNSGYELANATRDSLLRGLYENPELKGKVSIYWKSAKAFIFVDRDVSASNLASLTRQIVNNRQTYQHILNGNDHQSDLVKLLHKKPENMVGFALCDNFPPGMSIDEGLEYVRQAAKGQIANDQLVTVKFEKQGIKQASTLGTSAPKPNGIDHKILALIRADQTQFTSAAQLIPVLLPEAFQHVLKIKYKNLPPALHKLLLDSNYDIWTRKQFNGKKYVVYNVQAINRLNNTINTTTIRQLKNADKRLNGELSMVSGNAQETSKIHAQLTNIDADLLKPYGTELSRNSRILIADNYLTFNMDLRAVGAMNGLCGWDFTDDAGFHKFYKIFSERLALYLQKESLDAQVVLGGVGGDEITLQIISDTPLTDKARGSLAYQIRFLFEHSLEVTNSTIRKITKNDLAKSFVTDPQRAEFYWQERVQDFKDIIQKYAHENNVSEEKASKKLNITITGDTITAPTNLVEVYYNKMLVDADKLKKTKLFAILVENHLIDAEATGIVEIKVDYGQIAPETYKVLRKSGVLKTYNGVGATGIILNPNRQGLPIEVYLAGGDEFVKYAKLKGITFATQCEFEDLRRIKTSTINVQTIIEQDIAKQLVDEYKKEQAERIDLEKKATGWDGTERRSADRTPNAGEEARIRGRRQKDMVRKTSDGHTVQIETIDPSEISKITKVSDGTISEGQVSNIQYKVFQGAGAVTLIGFMIPNIGPIAIAVKGYNEGKASGTDIAKAVGVAVANVSAELLVFDRLMDGGFAVITKALERSLAKAGMNVALGNTVPLVGLAAGVLYTLYDAPEYIAEFVNEWDPTERQRSLEEIATGQEAFDIRQQSGYAVSEAYLQSFLTLYDAGFLQFGAEARGLPRFIEFMECLERYRAGDEESLREFKGGFWAKFLKTLNSNAMNRLLAEAIERFRAHYGLETDASPYLVTPAGAARLLLLRANDQERQALSIQNAPVDLKDFDYQKWAPQDIEDFAQALFFFNNLALSREAGLGHYTGVTLGDLQALNADKLPQLRHPRYAQAAQAQVPLWEKTIGLMAHAHQLGVFENKRRKWSEDPALQAMAHAWAIFRHSGRLNEIAHVFDQYDTKAVVSTLAQAIDDMEHLSQIRARAKRALAR